YLKQAQKKQQSLYDGKVLLEKHDPLVVHDSEETLQLAQEKTHNWSSSAHQVLHKIVKDENFPIVNQVDARVQNFEIQFLKEAAKFVGDLKSLAKEADESLAKHKVSDQKDNTRDTSANTKFAKQSIMENLPKKCLIFVNHDECLLNYVNGKKSHGKKQKALVSFKENQKKYQPKVKKPKKVGFIERLATPTLRKPRFLFRWSPTGRLFDLTGKILESSEPESQSDCSNGDNACSSNTMEPKIKRFPNSTSLLGRNDHVAAILGSGDLQWGTS
nr:hypothetical protein [Tanacetum cinerariifolium]